MRYDVSLTNYGDGASRAHLIRYFFAKGFISLGDTVIDAACGTGYGSYMLSEIADTVYAYDQIDKISHPKSNIIYNKVDLETYSNFPPCDVAVSLETIEHLTDASALIKNVCLGVRKFFVFSVPLGEELGANPFHKQVFSKNSIENLVSVANMQLFHSLMQGNHYLGVLCKKY